MNPVGGERAARELVIRDQELLVRLLVHLRIVGGKGLDDLGVRG